ncbi:MAG: hypothetical protein OXH97_08020 [Chloroflexota bacterium]|nr:hypothetical protein [Chloroflexota bacterium]
MSDLLLLLAVFWAAINPPASIASLPDTFEDMDSGGRRRLLVGGWLAAGVLLVAATMLHGQFLDLLGVAAPSFDIAAGIVMLAGTWRPLLRGRAVEESTASLLDTSDRAALIPLALPLLASPAALAAAISHGGRVGEGETIVVALVAAGIAALAMGAEPLLQWRHRQAVAGVLARLTGGFLVFIAVALIVDGVFSV